MSEKRIVLAADDLTLEQLLPLLKRIGHRLYAVKIHNLYDEYGPIVVTWLKNFDTKVWVDAKLHDIPKTVGLRAAAFKKAGADILTVHASGGVEMMCAAKEHGPAEIFGITVLTSLNHPDVLSIYNREIEDQVCELANKIRRAKLHGLVCSPQELVSLSMLQLDQKFVTPGIRSAGKDAHDQKRIATPGQAVLNGSNLLVVGRQLTEAKDPVLALEEIEREIEEALSQKEGV